MGLTAAIDPLRFDGRILRSLNRTSRCTRADRATIACVRFINDFMDGVVPLLLHHYYNTPLLEFTNEVPRMKLAYPQVRSLLSRLRGHLPSSLHRPKGEKPNGDTSAFLPYPRVVMPPMARIVVDPPSRSAEIPLLPNALFADFYTAHRFFTTAEKESRCRCAPPPVRVAPRFSENANPIANP